MDVDVLGQILELLGYLKQIYQIEQKSSVAHISIDDVTLDLISRTMKLLCAFGYRTRKGKESLAKRFPLLSDSELDNILPLSDTVLGFLAFTIISIYNYLIYVRHRKTWSRSQNLSIGCRLSMSLLMLLGVFLTLGYPVPLLYIDVLNLYWFIGIIIYGFRSIPQLGMVLSSGANGLDTLATILRCIGSALQGLNCFYTLESKYTSEYTFACYFMNCLWTFGAYYYTDATVRATESR
ncbi:hypothetical protein CANCADRAFT_57507 [Tortispora caseinolytica NRRL Y-17796]|uniref:Uncharacterized protein n=1 Tax=Tortispora caseinolytica NRRL Y-17796 TaxID=767744 RepID=A0A1E4THK2_9ASCO|nr:hypothetical protein CANCADRAFT_57507 [Tortispora caseinolytica NRRL Y-17796]